MPSTILSDNGASSGTAGIKTTGSNDGVLQLQTTTGGGTATAALTIDTSQNVGIGTSSPAGKLHIEGGTENAIIGSSSRKLYFRADNGGVMLATGTVQTGNGIYFNEASNYLYFQTASTERMRLTSDGYLRMASGTGGIQFGGDTAAANALDDYEEGTWTPTYIGTTSAGTTTFASRAGTYTKIGNKVFCECELNWSSATGTGDGIIGGLPFTVGPYSPDSRSLFFIAAYSGYTITGTLAGITQSNGNTVILYSINNGSLAGSSIKSAGVMRCQFAYTAA